MIIVWLARPRLLKDSCPVWLETVCSSTPFFSSKWNAHFPLNANHPGMFPIGIQWTTHIQLNWAPSVRRWISYSCSYAGSREKEKLWHKADNLQTQDTACQ